jgi:hypothetical protein
MIVQVRRLSVSYTDAKRGILCILLISIIASVFSNILFSNLSVLSNTNSNYNELFSQWFPKDNFGLAAEIPPGTSIALAQEEGETGDTPEGGEENSNNDEEEVQTMTKSRMIAIIIAMKMVINRRKSQPTRETVLPEKGLTLLKINV